MRWLLYILGGLVALILLIVVVGALLPVKHSVTRKLTLHQPPDVIWRVITDHPNEAQWRVDVASVTRLADRDGHPVWEEKYQTNDTMRIETIESVPPQRLVRKIVDQTIFGGIWTYQLTPSADGKSTTLAITEDGEVYNPVFRALAKFVFGHASTVERFLKALATKFNENDAAITP